MKSSTRKTLMSVASVLLKAGWLAVCAAAFLAYGVLSAILGLLVSGGGGGHISYQQQHFHYHEGD